jgi:DNA-directed RNA polymerase subunit RPC12/RpoP
MWASTKFRFMNTIKAIKRGVSAALAKPTPQKYEAGGKLIRCSHCGGEGFRPYHLSKFVSEELLREQYGLECAKCSHLEMFTKQPKEIADAG